MFSTSTKIAVYEDTTPLLVRNIRHSVGELSHFPRVIDQFEFRKNLVLKELEANNIPFEFDAIVGRGGLLKPIPGGVYEVNDAMLDDIFAQVQASGADVIDMRDDYRANKDQYLYFKTDHHWTPDGAYRAYQQFCTLKNLTPFDCNVYTKITVPDFYGTHYSATRRWNAQADSFSYYDLPNQMTVYKVNGEADYEPVKTEGLMNLAKLDTRDKYGAFLDGNNGYSVIEGNGTGSILVVKDSYANSFIPYLTANYAKIGVVDFRGLAYGLDSTIEKEGYDQILILYNFQTFISDNKVIYLDRPTTLK